VPTDDEDADEFLAEVVEAVVVPDVEPQVVTAGPPLPATAASCAGVSSR
jgi:hypothetical protein